MDLAGAGTHLVLKRQFFNFIGAKFRLYDANGTLIAVTKQKGFRLREDIRMYADEELTRETLTIQARQIMDFSAAYDVYDPVAQMKVGALRRKGWSSIIRDEWEVLDPQDNVIGKIKEDSMGLALIRRFLTNLVPQNYDMVMFDGRKVVDYKQRFNPFVYHLDIDFSSDPNKSLDRRISVAAAILLAAVEGRQRS